jgi:nucleoside-diphosphate-sugar epimerase
MRSGTVEADLDKITAMPLPFEQLEGTRVLISGANGFLPAYLVETLLWHNGQQRGRPTAVLALVRNAAKAQARFAHYSDRKDLNLIVQDVCQPVEIDGPIDFVIHAASQASPKYYGVDPAGTLSANSLGTHRMLELAREKQSRGMLYFSSAEVYGALSAADGSIAETALGYLDPLAPRACYSESKRFGETMCAAWHRQYGVPVKIVRPFHTYGPGMALDDGRVFSDFVADVVAGRDLVMKSDGNAVRAYCYLADATVGYLTVLLLGADGEAYNVGNRHAEASVAELAQQLADLFPAARLQVIRKNQAAAGYVPNQIERCVPDTSKLEALGWRATTSIVDGFRRTVQSFRQEAERLETRHAA